MYNSASRHCSVYNQLKEDEWWWMNSIYLPSWADSKPIQYHKNHLISEHKLMQVLKEVKQCLYNHLPPFHCSQLSTNDNKTTPISLHHARLCFVSPEWACIVEKIARNILWPQIITHCSWLQASSKINILFKYEIFLWITRVACVQNKH